MFRLSGTCEKPARRMSGQRQTPERFRVSGTALVAAAIPFRKTHDMVELADLALVPYPELRTLLDAIRRFTLWGVAYRDPPLEASPEPMPGEADLRSAIATISALAERLRSLAPSDGGAQP